MIQLMEAGGDVGGCITVYFWHRSYQCFGSGFIDSESGLSILGWILNTNLDPGFRWPKTEKNVQLTKRIRYFLNKKLLFTYSKVSIRDVRRPTSNYRRRLPSALKREHPTLQNMKFLNFFLFLWVIFALLDPDPLTWLNPNTIRIRIQNTWSYSSNHCVQYTNVWHWYYT